MPLFAWLPAFMHAAAPFFIVGCPRSGTTLVQRLLSAHPDATVLPETFFVRRLMPRRSSLTDPLTATQHQSLLRRIQQSEAWGMQSLDPDALHGQAQRHARTGAGVLRAWMQATADAHGVPFVGEKTPDHALQIEELHRALPDARFIHIVRDPRAVVNSWRSVPWSSGYAWRDAQLWRERVEAVRKAPASAPVHTITFETLVHHPESTMQRVAAFLGLDVHARWRSHAPDTVAVDAQVEPWKANALAPIDPTVATRWRTALPPADWAMVEAMTASEMAHWGYSPETDSAARRHARRRRWRHHLQWKVGLLVQAARDKLPRSPFN